VTALIYTFFNKGNIFVSTFSSVLYYFSAIGCNTKYTRLIHSFIQHFH